MGRVFRYSEVVAKRVPQDADFRAGKQDIWQTVEGCEDIIGAIVAGSIIHGTHNLRSDIDLVIYYRDTASARQAIAGLRQRCADRHLDLAVILVDTIIAQTRFHTISYGFYQHLSNVVQQGGLIKQNFLPLLRTDFYNAYGDAAEYLSFKLRYVGKAIDDLTSVDMEDKRHIEVLTKGLEVAVNSVRSLLDLKGVELVDDSKAGVIKAYRKLAPVELSQLLERLVEVDRSYTIMLKQQLGNPNREVYAQHIQHIADTLPMAKQFIRANAFWMEREHDSLMLAAQTDSERSRYKAMPVATATLSDSLLPN
ncbi:hypothetical protein EPO04_02135 [Patescibacteria group bacterium]|nr:MAG: hypothetical protein EPO04_02135 [Patescibacteria group bacterium]